MKAREKAERYKKLSLHYMENADHFIDAGDIEKASELLWGGITQALKAVAAVKDLYLRSHNALRDYAYDLERAIPGEGIWNSFNIAQSLHSNFYESDQTIEDVVIAAEDIRKTVAKLIDYIPKE